MFTAGPHVRAATPSSSKTAAAGVSTVEREIVAALPRGTTYNFHVTSVVEGQVDRTVKPEAIALGVFGAIAMLAALLIALQMIARQLQAKEEDREVLRALGASRAMAMGDGLLGILGAVVLGSLLAVGHRRRALAALAHRTGARRSTPTRGVALRCDRARHRPRRAHRRHRGRRVALAYRSAPGRARDGRAARAGAVLGGRPAGRLPSSAPVSAVTGIRFALEPGQGRTAVPVRSALFGTALAVLIVVATLTFGSGLDTLVSHPALYGWNWSYAISSNYLVPPQS